MLFRLCFGAGIGSGAFFIVLLINILLGGFCIHYVIEAGSVLIGNPIMIGMLPCFITGLFLGDIAIPVACVVYLINSIH